jgi:hypothetical protein
MLAAGLYLQQKGYNLAAGQIVMSVESINGNAAHLSLAEKAAIEQQLERILENRHFNHSRRFPAFLRFVVQKTLTGSTDLLKERTLGVEIFGRSADYDTSSDPIVRVTAAEIRKRLAQYYQEPGHENELRISVDAGSYVPQFHLPHQVPPPSSEIPFPAAAIAESIITAAAGTAPRDRHWPRLAVILLIVVASAGSLFAWRSAHITPVDFFWGPLLNTADPALFCIVQQHQYSNLAVDAADPTRQLTVKTDMSAVNLDDLSTIVKIGSLLRSVNKKFSLKGADVTTLSDIRNGPTIFVGAFDNAWTMRLTKPLRFHFGNDPEFKQEWIADSTSTKPPEWFTQRPVEENANNYREYAIVARFTDPDTGQLCVIAAGIGQGSTLAAGEFLSDPGRLAELQRIAPSASKKNVEVVLSTQIIDGQPGTPKIEASYFW